MTPIAWHGQLSHLALRSTDVTKASEFYVDHLGMTLAPTPDDGALLGWGLGDPVLELIGAAQPQLDHFALEIPDRRELDTVAVRLQQQGVEPGPVPDDGRHPDGFSIVDPDGRRVEFHGRIDRSGERSAATGWRPRRLQHITLATQSHARTLDFYETVLQMKVSDRMGDVFSWLRCGTEHHTVAIVESDADVLVDHFSFDLDGWGDFKTWCDRLGAAGVEVDWGPGRHGPGNNLFVMISAPDAYHVELSAEMESYLDDSATYAPRVWSAEPRSVNLWGAVPSWRAPQVA